MKLSAGCDWVDHDTGDAGAKLCAAALKTSISLD